MAIEHTSGIIIRLSDYSETSQIAVFLTPTAGKVSAIAKGAKRAASSTGGAMDLLTLNDIVYSGNASSGLATLREAKTVEQFDVARLSARHYYAALYLAELSDIFAEGAENPAESFDLLYKTLKGLQNAPAEKIGNLMAYFESRILAISGLAPNLDECTVCGASTPKAGGVRLSVPDGGIVCPACPGGRAISPAALAALRRVSESTVESAGRLRLDKRLMGEVGGVLSAMVVQGAHRVPRLARYVRRDCERALKRWIGAPQAPK